MVEYTLLIYWQHNGSVSCFYWQGVGLKALSLVRILTWLHLWSKGRHVDCNTSKHWFWRQVAFKGNLSWKKYAYCHSWPPNERDSCLTDILISTFSNWPVKMNHIGSDIPEYMLSPGHHAGQSQDYLGSKATNLIRSGHLFHDRFPLN